MTGKFDSPNTSAKRSPTLAETIRAVGFVPAESTRASGQAVHVLNVDLSRTDAVWSDMEYLEAGEPAYTLFVQKGGEIQWQVTPPAGSIPGSIDLVVLFSAAGPFGNNRPCAYHATGLAPTPPDTVTAETGEYKYHVVVVDRSVPDKPVAYIDDPRVIVGTGKAARRSASARSATHPHTLVHVNNREVRELVDVIEALK